MLDKSESEALQFEAIVSGLIAQNYCIMDDFLSQDAAMALLEVLLQRYEIGGFKQAGIGRGAEFQHNQKIRVDEIMWLENTDPDPRMRAFLDKLERVIDYLNQSCYAGIRDYEAHFAVYPPSAYYHRHLDQFHGIGHRRYTFIYYLNFEWEQAHGGCLRMYFQDKEIEKYQDVSPLAGRLVCFKSDAIPHEVLLTQQTRYSITGWWLDQEKTLEFL